MPLEEIVDRFRLEDVQRSPAYFDTKKLSHVNGVYIRALSLPDFVSAARPWVDPVPGEWAPGGWRDPDTGARQPIRRPGRPSASTQEKYLALAEVTRERVTVLGEVPGLVDFVFLSDTPDDPESWTKAVAGDEEAPRIFADALEAYETCPWDIESCTQPRWPSPNASAASWARPRLRFGWRSWDEPLASRSSTPWSCSAATTCRRLAGGWRAVPGSLMLLAPLRWALRIGVVVLAAIVLYFGVTLVQVWLTSCRSIRIRREPSSSWARLSPTACPHQTFGPGSNEADMLTPSRGGDAHLDHGDWQQAARRRLHRSGVGGEVSRKGGRRAGERHSRSWRRRQL